MSSKKVNLAARCGRAVHGEAFNAVIHGRYFVAVDAYINQGGAIFIEERVEVDCIQFGGRFDNHAVNAHGLREGGIVNGIKLPANGFLLTHALAVHRVPRAVWFGRR